VTNDVSVESNEGDKVKEDLGNKRLRGNVITSNKPWYGNDAQIPAVHPQGHRIPHLYSSIRLMIFGNMRKLMRSLEADPNCDLTRQVDCEATRGLTKPLAHVALHPRRCDGDGHVTACQRPLCI
jgi:hypothetical protein